MSNREHPEVVRQFQVHDVVRKPLYRPPANLRVRNSGHRRSDARRLGDSGHYDVDFILKLVTQAGTVRLVPAGRFDHFGVGFFANPNR